MHDRYHVVTGPPLSPPGTPAEALAGLADALNALEHPAAATLNDLTVDLVELAFNSLPPKDRQKLLGNLGIRMAAPDGPALLCARTFLPGCGATPGSTRATVGSGASRRP